MGDKDRAPTVAVESEAQPNDDSYKEQLLGKKFSLNVFMKTASCAIANFDCRCFPL